MTDQEKLKILRLALRKAGKYARTYLPQEVPLDNPNYLSAIAGGDYRDPEGDEYVYIWIQEAVDEIKGE